jgi:transposase
MHRDEYTVYVGLDWGSDTHHVCALDAERHVRGQRRVEHSAPGLAALADWLGTLAPGHPEQIAVALEVPRGAIVDTLLARGLHVFVINPKQLDRFRDRYSMAGAKDDRRDAFVAADALRTDRWAFRRLEPDQPLIVQLRELTRLTEDLQQELTRLANRLRDQLLRFYPALLRLAPAADEPWLWALLDLAPTPAAGAHLPRARIGRLLQQHRIRRLTPDAVREALRAPALSLTPGTVEAAASHVALLVPRLRLVSTQRAQCAAQLDALLTTLVAQAPPPGPQREHHDVEILRSLPGVGRLVAATMLAEAAALLAARAYHGLRAHAGVAPVTRQSGKRRGVLMRYGCNHHLQQAVYHWARVSVQRDPHSRAHYAALRLRGQSHPRALRGVADRLLAILVAMLKAGTLYDPARTRRREMAA